MEVRSVVRPLCPHTLQLNDPTGHEYLQRQFSRPKKHGKSYIDVFRIHVAHQCICLLFSQELNTPVIYVSFNYRTNSLGFLSSSTLVDKGLVNLGYYDQRLALHWVQTNIAAFGGDPAKVTIFGERSVGRHLGQYDH